MTNIKDALFQAQTFQELNAIANKASPQISFWGARFVTVVGYEGTLHIDDLADRVMKLVDENPNFDEVQRPTGKELTGLVNKIYEDHDQLLKEGNCLAHLLCCIREFFTENHSYGGFSGTRWIWQKCEEVVFSDGYQPLSRSYNGPGINQVFDYYTRIQYENVFGFPPDDKRLRTDEEEARGPAPDATGSNDWWGHWTAPTPEEEREGRLHAEAKRQLAAMRFVGPPVPRY